MSYCRSNGTDSDVYVIGTRDALECFGAGHKREAEIPVHDLIEVDSWTLEDDTIVKTGDTHTMPNSFLATSRQKMINHLLVHREAGHLVPDRAIERLQREIAEKGDTYPS